MPAPVLNRKVVQIAYHVRDIHIAAESMHRRFGAGPFIVNERIELAFAEHRGQPTNFVHSSAYGQWGDIMVELVQQDDDSLETPFRDMYTANQEGLHHTAVFVQDFEQGITEFERAGLTLATRCRTLHGGVDFGFVDARDAMGHFIELYEDSPTLLGFYQMVKEAAENWTGGDLFFSPGA